uniref:Uncharacterized protein n=1 Tax=Panagrolaimus sp. JU765 TaxID=591449 RepID=A0AC34PYV2_9BILA
MITFIHGFVYGVDKPITHCEYKLCKRAPHWNDSPVEFLKDYTIWPLGCPYQNRITIECSGKINPNATIALWDWDKYSSDDLVFTFNWTHIYDGQKKAYIDAFASPRQLDEDNSYKVELYFKFRNPCYGQKNKEYIFPNIVLNYTFIPE